VPELGHLWPSMGLSLVSNCVVVNGADAGGARWWMHCCWLLPSVAGGVLKQVVFRFDVI